MKNQTSFKLISDLFSGIIIFNEKGGVVLAGESVVKVLSEKGIDLQEMTQNGEKSPDGLKLLETIKAVSGDQYIDKFRFRGLDRDFILFRSQFSGIESVIMAFQQEIDRLSRIQSDLTERGKELECLYNISHELENFDDLEARLTNCVNHVRQGFQFPDIARVKIRYKKRVFGDIPEKNFSGDLLLTEPFLRGTKRIGEISVWYTQSKEFLVEENHLMKEIAGKLTRAFEKRQKSQDLDRRRQALIKKNLKLQELTEECREKREQLQAFFSAITDNIVVIDDSFNIIMSNNEKIGSSGKCYAKLFKGKDVCDNCPAIKTFTKAEPSFMEKTHDEKNFRLFAYPIFDKDNQVSSVLEVCRDITQQKMMEAQLLQSYKLASLGKLVTGVAHEINNPNTFILGI